MLSFRYHIQALRLARYHPAVVIKERLSNWKGNEFKTPKSWKVCLVGRPNVGKSTLFNKLARSKAAIVSPIPGTTRDRKERQCSFAGMEFTLVDTGGLEAAPEAAPRAGRRTAAAAAAAGAAAAGAAAAAAAAKGGGVQGGRGAAHRAGDGLGGAAVARMMLEQTRAGGAGADAVLLVVDARAGPLTDLDRQFARWLRKEGKGANEVIVVANKAEGDPSNPIYQECLEDAARLGFGDPVPISAEHGDGLGSLASRLIPHYDAWQLTNESDQKTEKSTEEEQEEQGPIRIAIVGRPNVGKSTLINACAGSNRVLTGPKPGLTRDAIPVEWAWGGRRLTLVDTAGLRRAWKVDRQEQLEDLAARDAIRSLNLAHVCVVMVDALEGRFVTQELKLLALAQREKRGLVVAANKSDALDVPRLLYEQRAREQLAALLPSMAEVPVVALSALEGEGVSRLMRAVLRVHDSWNARAPTAALNLWLTDALKMQAPPRGVKIRYITQIKSRPPTFVLFTNRADIPSSYMRYLRRRMCEDFKLNGVPLDFLIRKQEQRAASQRVANRRKKQLNAIY